MKNKFLAKTLNNVEVYIDSETEKHLFAHSELNMAHVIDAIGKMEFIPNADGSFCKKAESVDLGYFTGHDALVEITTANKEKVKLLYRVNRNHPSNVILSQGKETTKLMVVIGQIPDMGVMLFTACPGAMAPPESDEEFWATHALCCSKNEIDWEVSLSLL